MVHNLINCLFFVSVIHSSLESCTGSSHVTKYQVDNLGCRSGRAAWATWENIKIPQSGCSYIQTSCGSNCGASIHATLLDFLREDQSLGMLCPVPEACSHSPSPCPPHGCLQSFFPSSPSASGLLKIYSLPAVLSLKLLIKWHYFKIPKQPWTQKLYYSFSAPAIWESEIESWLNHPQVNPLEAKGLEVAGHNEPCSKPACTNTREPTEEF